METVVQKWGNSLGIRIPNLFVKEYALKNGAKVEIFDDDGKISIKPKGNYSLAELMENVTSENLHKSIDTGSAMGNEEW
jgi:antitoxin MazE